MAIEMVPFPKTGQVADVVGSLTKALRALGHDARVVMPRSRHIDEERFELRQVMEPVRVPINHRGDLATVYRTDLEPDVPVYMIDNQRYFGQGITARYTHDADPFIFYGRAALEMLKRMADVWQPQVIHCHDWQTAIIPNWLATVYRNDPVLSQVATVFTIHRLAHQGIFGYRVLELAGIKEHGFLYHSAIDDLCEMVDLMARGIYYADAITTVSERYAQEICTPEFGERLDPLLRDKSDGLFGILNGIDTVAFDPATDPHIAAHFDASSLERRATNKAALQRAFGLKESADVPIIGMVSRLNDTKGLDLLTSVFKVIMANVDVQFAVVGLGDSKYHELLSSFVQQFPGRVGLKLSFDDATEQRIYAGSDMFLMPSRVEPCGLGHMIAMRYGSVPIVRATGGLADTVRDYDPVAGLGSGFSFEPYDAMALFAAIVRAIEVHKHHDLWQSLQRRCMALDFSWSVSARKYEDIYRRARITHSQGTPQNGGWIG